MTAPVSMSKKEKWDDGCAGQLHVNQWERVLLGSIELLVVVTT